MIKNCTPHALTVHLANGEIRNFSKCKKPLRVSSKSHQVGELEGIPLFEIEMGAPENIPPVEEGVFWVVSAVAASHENLKHRQDLLCAGDLIRNEEGRVIGCQGLRKPN